MVFRDMYCGGSEKKGWIKLIEEESVHWRRAGMFCETGGARDEEKDSKRLNCEERQMANAQELEYYPHYNEYRFPPHLHFLRVKKECTGPVKEKGGRERLWMPHYAAVAFLREIFFFRTRPLHQLSLTNIHCAYLDSEQITHLLLEPFMQMLEIAC